MFVAARLSRALPISVVLHAAGLIALVALAQSTNSDHRYADSPVMIDIEHAEPTPRILDAVNSQADETAGEPLPPRPAPRTQSSNREQTSKAVSPENLTTPSEDPADDTSQKPAVGSVVGDVLGGSSGTGSSLGGFGSGGSGGGAGIGALTQQPISLDVAIPPALSKARPARLIYPSRRRVVDDSELFVVELHVDDSGYVTGVKLKRGRDPHSTAEALDAVWRFRYDPARNDKGDPISSKVTQKFHLNR